MGPSNLTHKRHTPLVETNDFPIVRHFGALVLGIRASEPK
jgi:hypothetical protein